MSFQIPDYIRTLSPYVPGKPIEETRRELGLKRVIKLASNENPLGPSPKGAAAARKAILELHRYPDGSAHHLKEKLAHGLKVRPTDLVCGNGSNEIIDLLIRSFCLPGDYVVTTRLAFIAYRLCAQVHGVQTLEAPHTEDLRFNLPEMAEWVRRYPNVKMVFIANPNNPTGTYVNEKELRDFLKEVSEVRGGSVMVVLDYAYWEYVNAPDLPDPMVLRKEFPNLVILRTFSKVYGLAGLRMGYAIAPQEVALTLERIRQPFNVNLPALAAAEAALDDQSFVRKAVKLNEVGMAYWEKNLLALGIPYWKSQGNFLLADVGKGLGRRGGDVYLSCLRRGVIFRPVTNYDLPECLRISIGTPEENQWGLQALAAESPQGAGVLKKTSKRAVKKKKTSKKKAKK